MICRALVERAVVAREEDTIRDLIRDTFQVGKQGAEGERDDTRLTAPTRPGGGCGS